tara:strand:+ start:763 stop:1542 length:780 start_codon:yes stop_codon:yes gene_type:complete
MELKKASKVFFILILSASCSKIKITTPASNFVSPEAQGKLLSGGVRLIQQAGTEGTVSFSNDSTENPLELRNNVTPLAGAADLGILEKLDLVVKGHSSAASVYMLKYQVLGDSRLEAQKGNQSLSFGVGYGELEQGQRDDSDSIIEQSSDGVEAAINESLLELSLIYGYRPQEDTLTYIGLHALRQNFDFELSSDSNATLDQEKFDIQTWAYGLSLGAVRYFSSNYYANLEISAQRTDYDNNDPTTFGFFTLAIGYNWD